MASEPKVKVEFYFDDSKKTSTRSYNEAEIKALKMSGIIWNGNKQYLIGAMDFDIINDTLRIDLKENK